MDLTVRVESRLDFAATARLAAEGFGVAADAFSPTRLEWLYRRAFSHGSMVLGLFDARRKVGQVTLLGQGLRVAGSLQPAVALVDLFILPAFRSRAAIETLYGRVEQVCRDEGIRYILAVPNGKAVGVNQRFLRLETAATLDIRVGLAAPWPRARGIASVAVADLGTSEALHLLTPFEQHDDLGLQWTADGLWQRLQDPEARYGLHLSDNLLLVSSARTRRRVPHTLLCAFLPRAERTAAARDVHALQSAAARFHGRPLTVYVGANHRVPLPGLPLPARLRPSLMLVQARDLSRKPEPLALRRFELLDFDFA